jgi:hypothetical protein
MPHVMMDGGTKAVDLELEVKAKLTSDEIVKYFEDWINGKPMPSKNPRLIQTLAKENVPEFAKSLLAKPFLKNFIEFNYDLKTWDKIEKILRSNLK